MAEADKKRKYLLFKKDDGRPDHLKPCAFYASAEGCKNGSKCRFMHEAPGAAPAPAPVYSAPVPTPAPVPVQSVYVPPPQQPKHAVEEATPKKDKKKRRTNEFLEQERNEVTFSQPPAAPTQPINPAQDSYQKLLEQQRALEQQLKSLSAMMNNAPPAAPAPQPEQQVAAPVSSAKKEKKNSSTTSSSSTLKPGNLFPTSQPATMSAPAMPFFPVSVPVPAPVVVAAAPVAAPVSHKRPANYDSSSDDEEFLFKAVNHALDSGRTEVKKPAVPIAKPASTPAPVSAPSDPSSLNTVLSVVASSIDSSNFPFVDPASALKALETSGTAHATQGPGAKNKKKDIFASPAGKGSSSSGAAAPVALFDPSAINFSSIDWTALVQRTQSHKRFKQDYNFSTDQTWLTSRSSETMANTNAPMAIAIDCEMCETADPVTGEKDKNSLIRFSIVNALNPSQVLLDSLVQPNMPVTDLRTRIHGITEEQLSSVKFTLRHAQAALYNLISDKTIIIGHSVHNDLKALHFNHSRVVDTAYLYSLDNEPESMPSLRVVAEQVLGFQLGDSHDSVKDACTSLYAAVYAAQHGPIAGLFRHGKNSGSSSSNEPSLLLHRLPDYCQEDHIMRVMIAYTNVVPTRIAPIVRGDPSGTEPVGKTTVYFSTQQHAELAFESISGPLRPDKQNKPQKRIYLKGGGYIYVRK